MRLVYTKDGSEVKVGDEVVVEYRREKECFVVEYFRKPHSPASSGKVTVRNEEGLSCEFYVSIIGAEWIEREDREPIEEDTIHGYFHEVNK